MLLLLAEAQARAVAFIAAHARPLEQARYAHAFQDGSQEAVFEALATYQNPDGGFGKALEPDLRLPDSSVIATTVALQILRELDAPAGHALVQGAMDYLRQTYDAAVRSWPIVPPHVDDAPHAPWWTYRDDPCLSNPRPEIAGYFVQYAPGDLPEGLLDAVVAHMESLSDDAFRGSHDDLLCYIRLMETPGLPDDITRRLLRKGRRMVASLVPRKPAAWAGYVLHPLKVVRTPDSPFMGELGDAVSLNLDALIERQGDDGAWSPNWTWGDLYPETWPVAAQEWKGHLTLEALKTLRAHGRLA